MHNASQCFSDWDHRYVDHYQRWLMWTKLAFQSWRPVTIDFWNHRKYWRRLKVWANELDFYRQANQTLANLLKDNPAPRSWNRYGGRNSSSSLSDSHFRVVSALKTRWYILTIKPIDYFKHSIPLLQTNDWPSLCRYFGFARVRRCRRRRRSWPAPATQIV